MSNVTTKPHSVLAAATLLLVVLRWGNVVNSQIPGGSFTDVKLVPNVNTPDTWELLPYISPNGRELYLSRGPTGQANIWVARRESTLVDFGEPVMLGPPINSDASEVGSRLSDDGLTMIFNSSRDGNYDIFAATGR